MSRTTVSTMVGELMGRGLIATLDEEPEALSTAAPKPVASRSPTVLAKRASHQPS